MHDDSFRAHSNISKSAGLTLSFHVCPFFCSFNGMIIENASRLLFIFKALVRSTVQALAGPTVSARWYLLLLPVLPPKQYKTRGHTRPPYQENLLMHLQLYWQMPCHGENLFHLGVEVLNKFCWPDCAYIGCTVVQCTGKHSLRFM